MSAQSSATVAQAATAVVEGLAVDLKSRGRLYESGDRAVEDSGYGCKRNQSVHLGESVRADLPSTTDSKALPISKSKIDILRDEKNRLVKELYGTSTSD